MPRKGPRVRDPKRRIIRVRLSEGLYQRLMDHADATGQPVSAIVRLALRKFYREHE
jgi:predicted DNA-binding protein